MNAALSSPLMNTRTATLSPLHTQLHLIELVKDIQNHLVRTGDIACTTTVVLRPSPEDVGESRVDVKVPVHHDEAEPQH